MAPTEISESTVTVAARDGYSLQGTLFSAGEPTDRFILLHSAMGVPRTFYARFAAAIAATGYRVLTYDVRGIDGSRPPSLRGFSATVADWALLDLAGAIDWISRHHRPSRLFLVGHSLGGQIAGLIDNADALAAMVTVSSQSGHWRLQGPGQRLPVLLHGYLTLPVLSVLWGYLPWSRFARGCDLPKGVALQWSRWVRHPDYLFGDPTLPTHRYRTFRAPILAYSFEDDAWGTERAVDTLMRAYPTVERRHVSPAAEGLPPIGHFGYFRPDAAPLWQQTLTWLAAR